MKPALTPGSLPPALHTLATTALALAVAGHTMAIFDLDWIWITLVLVTVAIGGHSLYAGFEELREHFLRPAVTSLLTAVFALIALAGVVSLAQRDAQRVSDAASFFLVSLGFLLFVRGSTRGDLLFHFNLILLQILNLAGPPALFISSLASYAFLLIGWLTVDHAIRRGVSVASSFREALALAVPFSALVMLGLLPFDWTPITSEVPEIGEPLDGGSLTGSFVLAVVLVAVYFLVRRGQEEDSPVPAQETEWTEQVYAPHASQLFEEAEASGPRGRVIARFLSVLQSLEQEGYERLPHHTAGRLSRQLKSTEASHLTELFERARYSQEVITEADDDRAQRLAEVVEQQFLRRRSS